MTPTKLDHAFSTMSLQQPDDGWYIDSTTTFHMTRNSGMLMPLSKFSTNNHILVGNGVHILITSYGHISPPPKLTLRDIFLTPQIIKNLISVRKYICVVLHICIYVKKF